MKVLKLLIFWAVLFFIPSSGSATLIAYWQLDEGSGTTVSDSIGGLTGNFVGNPTWGQGINGSFGLNLDSTPYDERVQISVPASNILNTLGQPGVSYSVDAWFKTATQTVTPFDRHVIVGKDDGFYNFPFELGLEGGIPYFSIHFRRPDGYTGPEHDVILNAGTTYMDGQWHRIIGIRDQSTMVASLYIDGLLAAQAADQAGNTSNYDGITIGNGGDYYREFPYSGDIDNIKIYNHALSQNEINPNTIHEPATMMLLGVGLISIAGIRRKFHR